jgi:hypothetical protein
VSADLTLEPVGTQIALAGTKSVGAPDPVAKSTAASASNSSLPNLPNPRLYIDPSLNRVVLEFFDSKGTLTHTIPSLKQLEAYRLAAFSGNPVSTLDGQGS